MWYKKGDLQSDLFFVVIDLLLVFTLFFSFSNYLKGVEDDSSFEQSVLSRDLSLLLGTVSVAPDPISIIYDSGSFSISDFDYSFDSGDVSVNKEGGFKVSFPYISSREVSIGEISKPDSIFFTREENVSSASFVSKQYWCPNISSSGTMNYRILDDDSYIAKLTSDSLGGGGVDGEGVLLFLKSNPLENQIFIFNNPYSDNPIKERKLACLIYEEVKKNALLNGWEVFLYDSGDINGLTISIGVEKNIASSIKKGLERFYE